MRSSPLRIARALHKQLSGSGYRDVRSHLLLASLDFARSGLADRKFESELTCGDPEKFWSSISEALVFKKLNGMTFLQRTKLGAGPDFLVDCDGKRVWIEVICPSPIGLPSEWLNPVHGGVINKPANEILLRWTHAIKTKADRLIGTPSKHGYLEEGLVGPDDAYILAVNGCRFRHGPFPELDGISQLPYAVEASFPVGPIELRIDVKTMKTVDTGYQRRWAIKKPNETGGVNVPTYAFLDPRYRPVSAIWALDSNGSCAIGVIEPSALVHNPNAANPVPHGWITASQEFAAFMDADGQLSLQHV